MQVVTRPRAGMSSSTGAASGAQQGYTTPREVVPGEEVTVTNPAPVDLPSDRKWPPRTTPLVQPHRVSSLPTSSSLRDTSFNALPDETPEVDDSDGLVLDVPRILSAGV